MSTQSDTSNYNSCVSEKSKYEEDKRRLILAKNKYIKILDEDYDTSERNINKFYSSVKEVFGAWDWEGQTVKDFADKYEQEVKNNVSVQKNIHYLVVGEMETKIRQLEEQIAQAGYRMDSLKRSIDNNKKK